ncbi:MAG: hypothetical protein WCP28_18815 [Actinomycetes bacterium]
MLAPLAEHDSRNTTNPQREADHFGFGLSAAAFAPDAVLAPDAAFPIACRMAASVPAGWEGSRWLPVSAP